MTPCRWSRKSWSGTLAETRRRFLDEGYTAAALPAVAADAGVSVGSVYKAFRNEAGVLKAIFDVAAAWQRLEAERLTGMTAFATELTATGRTRAGLSTADVRDVLWTFNSVSIYELLVRERGWSAERYGRFVGDALVAALVGA